MLTIICSSFSTSTGVSVIAYVGDGGGKREMRDEQVGTARVAGQRLGGCVMTMTRGQRPLKFEDSEEIQDLQLTAGHYFTVMFNFLFRARRRDTE